MNEPAPRPPAGSGHLPGVPADAAAKDPRLLFGRIAVEHGFCTEQQIVECRKQQEQAIAAGVRPKKLGDLLIEKGYLAPHQVQEIFRIQGREGGHRHISGYQLLEKIGQGAMGLVFRAKQLSMDRTVAIKVLYPRLAKDQKFVTRFLQEARASAKLNHINIIGGIDVGESNGIYYFAMEYVDGKTLQAVLKRGGALDEKRAVTIALQVAKALDHAHRHAIIHRDVKPDNVMVAADGTAKLCDLGLARSTRSASTEHGMTLGTPNYISPEQIRGDSDIDGRTDIYGLGATFFHMLTGRTPYVGNATSVMAQHLSDPVPDPRSVNPEVHDYSAAICMRMMQKEPSSRPQSPRELMTQLEDALQRLEMQLDPTVRHGGVPPQRPVQPAPPPLIQPGGGAPPGIPPHVAPAPAAPQAYPSGVVPPNAVPPAAAAPGARPGPRRRHGAIGRRLRRR